VLAIEHVESENLSEMSDLLLKLCLTIHPLNLLERNQNRRIFVFEREYQEVGRRRLACVMARGCLIDPKRLTTSSVKPAIEAGIMLFAEVLEA